MATPFDAAAKDLIEMAPADWLAFLGQPRPPELVRVIDADLSATVTTSTDKVIRVDDLEPWLLLIELQAAWDGDLPYDLLRRYALLRHRHRVPVSCAIVLLRPEANTSAMTGTFLQPDRLGRDWEFPFHMVRVWETPAEVFLQGPLVMLPLAPVAAVDQDALDSVMSQVAGRLNRDATRGQKETLQTATFQLLALRYDEALIEHLKELMATLDISGTALVKSIQRDAALAARRDDLLALGRDKFGEPPADILTEVQLIADESRLSALLRRVLRAASWHDLVAGVP
jgi:hypothetical protein